MSVACVGNIVATAATSVGPRFFAMFLMPMGAVSSCRDIPFLPPPRSVDTATYPGTDQIILSWIANSFPRPLVKRSASIAIANMIGNTATIYGSYMYPSSSGPQYIPGGSTNAVVCLVVASLALVLRFVHKRENRKLEQVEQAALVADATEQSAPVVRDTPMAGFRYIY